MCTISMHSAMLRHNLMSILPFVVLLAIGLWVSGMYRALYVGLFVCWPAGTTFWPSTDKEASLQCMLRAREPKGQPPRASQAGIAIKLCLSKAVCIDMVHIIA